MRMRSLWLRAGLVLAPLGLYHAAAKGDGRFAEEPTSGLDLPFGTLAGEQDATAVVLNPAGLTFLGDSHVELVATGLDESFAEGPGAGLGAYAATPVRLPLMPHLGFGLALEKLLPPRLGLAPDPGAPTRFSVAAAYQLAPGVAFGLAWRRFNDDAGGGLDGLDTLDVGLASRLGRHLAFGAVVRDAVTPVVSGVPVQRRYQLEVVARPLGSDRLELAAGMTLGERRRDVDPSLRVGVRLGRGLWLRGQVAALGLWDLDEPAFGSGPANLRYAVRASLGLEASLGNAGAAFYGTAGRDVHGSVRLLGGTAFLRWSAERLPSVWPAPRRTERVDLMGSLDERKLARVLLGLRQIERDGSVVAVAFTIDNLQIGWASAQELRAAIQRLRARGKETTAFMTAGSTRDYYVASACHKVVLDCAGGLRLVGLSSTVLFFAGLFDHIGVEAQFEKIEEYKSAPEAFTRTDSSEPARQMRNALSDDIYGRLVADLAADRGQREDSIRAIIERGPFTAAEALQSALVDELVTPETRGPSVTGGPQVRPDAWAHPQIALVFIAGDIVDGESKDIPVLGRKLVGGDTIARAIAWARDDPEVKAIVLRIDSPGGSALASEKIAREVATVRGRKPVIVSMGDVAASGGYFAAAFGDVIFAQPSTITGSIGIFTGKFDMSRLASRLGLTWEVTKRGQHADMESLFRPYTEEERTAIKEKLRYYYDRFIGTVAEGRKMTKAEVDDVGRGRVWTGAQAKAQGLVDRLGGLVEAMALAKERAGLGDEEPTEVVMLPAAPESLIGKVLKLAGGSASNDLVLETLFQALPASLVGAPGTPQARLPFVLADDVPWLAE